MIFSLAGIGRISRALGPLCLLLGWNLSKSDQKEALDSGSGDSSASRPSSVLGLSLGFCSQLLGPSVGSPAGAEGGPKLWDRVISCRLK